MIKLKIILPLLFINMILSCSKNENKKIDDPEIKNLKIEAFQDVDGTINKLSDNGIGGLGNWKGDELGYISSTNYYEFGNSSGGLSNNIAYYLESDEEKNIKTLKLVLNINNKSEKKLALSKFLEITESTFQDLSLPITDELINAITQPKELSLNNGVYDLKLELDKSKIDTWKLIIQSE